MVDRTNYFELMPREQLEEALGFRGGQKMRNAAV